MNNPKWQSPQYNKHAFGTDFISDAIDEAAKYWLSDLIINTVWSQESTFVYNTMGNIRP